MGRPQKALVDDALLQGAALEAMLCRLRADHIDQLLIVVAGEGRQLLPYFTPVPLVPVHEPYLLESGPLQRPAGLVEGFHPEIEVDELEPFPGNGRAGLFPAG